MIWFLTKDSKIGFNHLTLEPRPPFQSEMLHKLRHLNCSNCSRGQFCDLRIVRTQMVKTSIHHNPDDDDDDNSNNNMNSKSSIGCNGFYDMFQLARVIVRLCSEPFGFSTIVTYSSGGCWSV
jgi:hypothetical protein